MTELTAETAGKAMRPTPVQSRADAIDVLRVWAMLGVVASHATVSYLSMPTPEVVWVVHDRVTSGVFDIFFWVSGVLLDIFFLIGGYAAAALYDRKGPAGFLRDRGRRLLAPLLVAGLVTLPLTLYVWSAGWWLDGRCTLNDIRRVVFARPIQDHLYGPLHLWFLEYLLIYTAAYWGIRVWMQRRKPEPAVGASIRGIGPHLGWFVGASTFILLVDVGAVANLHNSFVPAPARLLYHGVFFAAGALWLSRPGALQRLTASGLFVGVLWLPVFACTTLLFRDYLSGPLPVAERVLLSLAVAAFVWLSVFGCFGLAHRAGRGRWAGVGLLGAASYWVYVIHFPIVGAAHLLLSRIDVTPFIKFPCVIGITLAVSLWSYRKLVQRSAFGAWLGWTKPRAALPAERPWNVDHPAASVKKNLAGWGQAVVEGQDTSPPI